MQTCEDTRDDYDANGVRTQTFTYLLEKEGDFVLPAATTQWWNPYSRRVFERSTDAIKIHVAANPNLGILATIKDSLTAKQPVATVAAITQRPLSYLWYSLVLVCTVRLAALFLLYLVVRSSVSIYKIFAPVLYKLY
jgi:hypothetical protein